MSRRVLLLDVTAMAADAVCVAGIDLKSGAQVRLNEPQPTRTMVAGWSLCPGDVIRVDYRQLRPSRPPHTEDCKWNPRSLHREGGMPLEDIRGLAAKTAFASIEAAFGSATAKGSGRNSAWTPGKGQRSLATLAVRSVRAGRDRSGKVRLTLSDDSGELFDAIPFQDLLVRDHEASCVDCRGGYLEHIQREFDADHALVRIGLTRPFQAHSEDASLCWLQVTNILARPRIHFRGAGGAVGAVHDTAAGNHVGILDKLSSMVRRALGGTHDAGGAG